jgi:hypothetical protein
VTTKPTVTNCPECGVSMAGRDPLKHSYKHWPEGRNTGPVSKEAVDRAAKLGRTLRIS